MILHVAGPPGDTGRDQICRKCGRVLRLRGSNPMFELAEPVVEARQHGRVVLLAGHGHGQGVDCRAIEVHPELRDEALNGGLARTMGDHFGGGPARSKRLPSLEEIERG